jgi:ATP-dependent Clp protease ATP-binding subunit ClpC
VHEHLSAQGLEALHLAEEQARAMGHDYLGTEHLLLALLTQRTRAAAALSALGVEVGVVRAETERIVGLGEGGRDSILLTPLARRALEETTRQAQAQEHRSAGCEDLLRGLAAVPDGLAARILTSLDVSPEQIEATLSGVSGPGNDSRS